MEKRVYLDIHIIQTVPPSCVNRDDSGSPKTATYGGVKRARVSSQSWKRAMRLYFRERFDESELGIRTTKIVELVAAQIIKIDPSVSEAEAYKMARSVLEAASVKTAPKKKGKSAEESEGPAESAALFFMTTKQANNLAELALVGGYGKKEAVDALNKGNGIDIALFGRMVADNSSINVDASSQVAHSISTHRVENEYDYFTAVDDLSSEENAGAGMIGTVEFNSSTLYRYATLAVHDLYSQLSEDKTATSKAVVEFIRAFVASMPTGKQNTFANRTMPDAVMLSVRNDQPINLAGAFESPVQPDREAGGYARQSVLRLVDYDVKVCSTFASKPLKTWYIGKDMETAGPVSDLSAALDGVGQFILGEL